MGYLDAYEVLPELQTLINSVENVDEIKGGIKDDLQRLYDHYIKILRSEEVQNSEHFEHDDLAEYYLPAGTFDNFFIPR